MYLLLILSVFAPCRQHSSRLLKWKCDLVFTQGEEGVKTVLKIMKNELERAMMLAGIKMLVNFNDTVSDAT